MKVTMKDGRVITVEEGDRQGRWLICQTWPDGRKSKIPIRCSDYHAERLLVELVIAQKDEVARVDP